ncbi:hypothetical protein AK830_g2733 [Neonectria ditissima]|uniref:Carrier domain-containing protein n=1 Tax=Neonectria ditissima TaxID=78410 RepID=A0A0P7BSS1_9HYPO|nr:hypothetical protein AK830_g2733 [Neonectria ditissima]
MDGANQTPKSQYGRRLIVRIVDSVAANDPSRPFIFIPTTSSNPSDGWKPVTYRELSGAVNSVAWQITQRYGPGFQGEIRHVAYIGANDVRYAIMVLGCIKAGYQAFLLSPRNSSEAQKSLLDKTGCRIFWHTEAFSTLVKSWIGPRQIKTDTVPSVDTMLAETSPPFPYNRTFEEARWDPAFTLHTSGSTGIPKPIVVKQGNFIIADALRDLPELHGGRYQSRAWADRAERMLLAMPLFHAAGIVVLLSMTLVYDIAIALGVPDRPLTSDLAIECLNSAGVQGALLPPVILEEMSASEAGISALKKLNFAAFGGGNLAQKAGDILVRRGVIVSNGIAATEYCPYPIHFQTNMENWQYFIFNNQVMGCEWRPFGEDGLYELVVSRSDTRDPGHQAVFYTFPDLDEWSTKDLYRPHPTLSDHWMFCGRIDDVIVFSTGEKLNPATMEEIISGHPSVKGALIVGQDRFQAALVLEPMSPREGDAVEALIAEVWPLVEHANAETVAHGQIVRWLIGVSPPEKSFLRTPKGTTLRADTVRLLQEEIDLLYQDQQVKGPGTSVDLNLSGEDALASSLVGLVTDLTGVHGLGDETDFFDAGLDSLRVFSIIRLLEARLKSEGIRLGPETLTPRAVYRNPTAKQLASFLYSRTNQKGPSEEFQDERDVKKSEELLSKYIRDLPLSRPGKQEPLHDGQTVLVTGTTGSLGSYLLEQLCTLKTVKKVVAVNRGQDGAVRQAKASASRGLGTDFSKVQFLEADLSLPRLGMDQTTYKHLLRLVDRIIHNAWPVNFNLGVASFEPHIRGVRHLVDFSAASEKLIPLVFLSSISTASGWTKMKPVPEERLEDLTLPRMGYGQSKQIGSLILDAASKTSGIPTASIRLGQIAGPKSTNGEWNRREMIPSLVASSVHLGILPSHLGPSQVVDWIPIEDMATLILDVAGVTTRIPASEISGYFHAVNPTTIEWSELANVVKDYYGEQIQELVGFEDWISKLENSARDTKSLSKNPAVKLLDTYRSMIAADQAGHRHVEFSMEGTRVRSPTVGKLGEITPELMRNWCRQWKF